MIKIKNCILYPLICTFFLISCAQLAKEKIVVIRYTAEYKDQYSNEKIEDDVIRFNIAYYKDFTVFEIPTTIYGDGKSFKDGDTVKNELVIKDTTYKYFVIKKNLKKGFVYEKLDDKSPKVFLLDSLLSTKGLNPESMKIFNLNLGTPKTVKKGDLLIEKFEPLKKNIEDCDTVYRYYDKNLKGIRLSFSEALDKAHKSKLIKTHFITLYAAGKTQNASVRKIRSDNIEGITEISISYSDRLIDLVNTFESESKNFNLK